MARSPSEYALDPFAHPRDASPPDSPGTVPPGLPLMEPQPGARRPRQTWLLGAAVVLAVLGVAAFVIPAAGAGHGRAFAAGGAAVVLLLAGVVFVLYRQHDAAVADVASWEQRAAEQQQRVAEQQQRAASWEQRAAQQQQRADEFGRRTGDQEDHYRRIMAGLEEAADHLLHVRLPAVLEGSAVPQSFSGSGAAGSGEAAVLFDRVGAAVVEGAAKLRVQCDDLRVQYDGLRVQRDGLRVQCEELRVQCDGLRLQCEELQVQCDEIRERFEDHSESSRKAVLELSRLLQSSSHRIQARAARMQHDHSADPGVIEASMDVEHLAAQLARKAQSLVVLCDEWPGQQWADPLALPDVVRAAAGRIMSYKRVDVSGDHGIAAAAGIVEPLIHLVAELLANAAQSSPSATQVQATVQAVQTGAVIEIDDRGIGMEEAKFRQVEEIISGRRLIGLGDFGEFPQTGLAVVGRYVRRHGFLVELRRSVYGGVRAVVLVPEPLVVNSVEPAAAAPLTLAAPIPPRSAQEGRREPDGRVLDRRMPRRQSLRGQALPGRDVGLQAEPAVPSEEGTPEQAGEFLAAYLGPGEAAATADPGTAQETKEDTAFPDETEW
jgi:signal transduction histidine kinase